METNYRSTNVNNIESATVVSDNAVLKGSFAWMALAMLLTTLTALGFANSEFLLSMLLSNRIVFYIVLFAPLIFVWVMGARFEKLSFGALIGLFAAYSIINGVTFSVIFLVYSIGSIVKVFLSTSALFAIMAIAGYTTKTDLTKLGNILMIGVIGIVIASLINFFTKSETADYIISILGVIIFTGLTAYDVQKIKNMGQQVGFDGTLTRKLSVMGALTLYLDFINLFLFLLRLFGDRK
ncbi:MAG: Bax inhibitor-1/YccA family protein [Sediminibacterium sp.]|nr:Bax inhibitor-1/YccA family protein [Sediminibacterium sp.]